MEQKFFVVVDRKIHKLDPITGLERKETSTVSVYLSGYLREEITIK